jgi:membrane-associated phospholipid phosphatase
MSGHAYTVAAMPRPHVADRRRRTDSVAQPLWLAALCVALGALLWLLAEHVPTLQVKDAVLLHDFVRLDSSTAVDRVAKLLPQLLNPVLFIIWGLALVLFALSQERPRVALAVVAVMALAPFSAEILKPLLAHPHVRIGYTQIGAASWPSGHSSAATALALSAILVAPARFRTAVAFAAVTFALAVGAALLIRAWHMPSDVLGGYLNGIFWMALAVAGLRACERRRPPKLPRA